MPVNNLIAIKIHRDDAGCYAIHSISGAVRLRINAYAGAKNDQHEVESLRVGDEITEDQIEYITMHSQIYKVTIVRGD